MAHRSLTLDLLSEDDWRLADERARLLAPLAESGNGSVADIDQVGRLGLPAKLRFSRSEVGRGLRGRGPAGR
jgi:hypothetical protein